MPSVCPQCRSTAVDDTLLVARCHMCGWKGSTSELLLVVSEGVTLEDGLDRFTRDLFALAEAHWSGPLAQFLRRWEVINEETKDRVVRFLLARSVQEVAGEILRYLVFVAEQAAKAREET